MKCRLIISLFLLIPAISMMAQTVQQVRVLEYNGKKQKTALPGVEVRVKGAPSTVSSKAGDCYLKFLTMKPGDRVQVMRIEKQDFDVFNMEALQQWNLSRGGSSFTIVMCRKDRFKKLRDTYWQVSSKSYERQYRQEEAKLSQERKKQRLAEAEYRQKLAELKQTYEEQLDHLDTYVDKFARIDLSELDSVEQGIIELVQKGEIDQAIKKYEDMNLLGKYQKVATERMEAHQAQQKLDSLIQVKEQVVARLKSIVKQGISLHSKNCDREQAISDCILLLNADPEDEELKRIYEELTSQNP